LYTASAKYPVLDVLTRGDEEIIEGKEIIIRPASNHMKKCSITPSKVVALMNVAWDGQKENVDKLEDARKFALAEMQSFNPDVLALKNPKKYEIYLSDKLSTEFNGLKEKHMVVKTIA